MGSRSPPPPLFLLLFFSLLSLCRMPAAAAAVATIDLGSEWVKVAVVHLKPGHSPISVAINEMSKRKSPALVAFSSGNRLLAEEAAGIAARFPDKVYSLVRDIAGKPYAHAKALASSAYLPFDLVEDERGSAAFRIEDGVTVYTAEELLAMVLNYAIRLAEAHAKVRVRDAVITVPPYFGQAERKAMVQAAQLAGINVLALINEHAGAALQYGIDKNLANESRNVIFYDMGAGSTYAALVQFSSYQAKEFGKTVSVNQFQVKDVRWNSDLGGQHMELRLVEHFADEFNKKVGNGVDIRNFPKAMSKLKKQVKRTKEILSANTAAPISVESLYDDRDFRSTITREKFEELCGDLWDKALDPVKILLTESGLKIEEVYAVELIGGATRVPKLQAKLQEFLGRNDLDKHLDADEAIVLGAALHAANLSDGIKLNRKLGMIDSSPYGFTIKVEATDLPEAEKTEVLVPRMKKLPIKLFRSIKHDQDFEVSLGYENSILPPGVSSDTFAHFAISGLTDANDKYSSRNLSAPIKANLHFTLSRSGIISLDRAEAVIEYFEWVEVPKKNLTIENSTVSGNISAEANSESVGDDKEKLSTDDELKNPSTAEHVNSDVPLEKKLKKRTFRVPLKVVDKYVGPGASLSKESLSSAKSRLEALDKKDSEKRKTAELKNNLEEYIYAMREKLEDPSEIEKVSSEQQRKTFGEKLEEIQDWLYTDGEDASANEFQERLDLLKSFGDPIFFRLSELTARPDACQHAKSYLEELEKIVSDWDANKTWLPKTRVDEVVKAGEKLKIWLEEKEALQKKTSHFSTPAFTSQEVQDKVSDLQDKVASINRIPKPKPKIEKPPKDSPKTEQGGTELSDSTSNGDGSQPNEQPVETEEAESHDEL